VANTILEIVGFLMVAAFLALVWPPLLLGAGGVVLIVAANRGDV